MSKKTVTTVQTSVERRQRALLMQIATQRINLAAAQMRVAAAEMRLAALTAELHEAAPGAYGRMLEQRTQEILRQRAEVAS